MVVHSSSEAGDAETLTGCAPDENIDSCILTLLNCCEIPVQGHIGVVVGKHGAGELVDLREEGRLPPKLVPCRSRGLDAAANASVNHRTIYVPS